MAQAGRGTAVSHICMYNKVKVEKFDQKIGKVHTFIKRIRDYYLSSLKDSSGRARKSQKNIASPTEMTPIWSGVKPTWQIS